MTSTNKSPALAAPGLKNTSQTNNSAAPRKWQRVLTALLSGRSYNRFEATRDLRDWCLHTTVAGLEARGIRIDRHDEVVPGLYGAVHCKRYRLPPESRQRAMELLGNVLPLSGASDAPCMLPVEAGHGAAPTETE